jgi:nitroimidazol reductase NimA-like FMN-containing flavoprotein (pyridoxamine 5'-phosphate oxidase superfamily)
MVQVVQGSESEVYRLPSMTDEETDTLLRSQRICRMALNDRPQPYIIPLDYVYMDHKMYFHFANYGKKIQLFDNDPHVSVEVDKYNEDVSKYCSVTLMGRLVKVSDQQEKNRVSEALLNRIDAGGKESNVAARHGYEKLNDKTLSSSSSLLFRLDVDQYVALKSPGL